MPLDVPPNGYVRIRDLITNPDTVGIDAERTHVMIIHILEDLQRRGGARGHGPRIILRVLPAGNRI